VCILFDRVGQCAMHIPLRATDVRRTGGIACLLSWKRSVAIPYRNRAAAVPRMLIGGTWVGYDVVYSVQCLHLTNLCTGAFAFSHHITHSPSLFLYSISAPSASHHPITRQHSTVYPAPCQPPKPVARASALVPPKSRTRAPRRVTRECGSELVLVLGWCRG
jgi:hypothetical protein